ncbi:L-asparaginase 1-like isoform X4 [Lepisosteus oculatus]|uniref:L-asparaginase 1-like isoform X4 n=1 Tax=Lepisosteus oculatus TaxID=7918 RepID=UPI003721860F
MAETPSPAPQIQKVLVLYTGGTVGMVPGSAGYVPGQKGDFSKEFRRHPEIFEKEEKSWFILPKKVTNECPGKVQVRYQVEEEEKPIDSSKITPELWDKFASKIQGLKKPVVVTGAQRSLFEPRSDAVDNILGALMIAGCYCQDPALQLVSVLFNHKLFRGNRVTKYDCDSFDAFSSPNAEPLVEMGVTIKVNAKPPLDCVESSQPLTPLKVKSFDVRVLHLFPGIQKSYVKSVLAGDGGVILETYGSGNAPDDDWFIDALKAATDRGVLILNCTQVYKGSVRPIYETGTGLEKAGVLSGFDITSEAALTKMLWCLQVTKIPEERKKIMQKSICGEMTVSEKKDPTADRRVVASPEDLPAACLLWEKMLSCDPE